MILGAFILWGTVESSVEPLHEIRSVIGWGSGVLGFAIFTFGWMRLTEKPSGAVLVNAPRAERPSHWRRHRVLYISNRRSLLPGGAISYLVNQLPSLGG
ncbi:hypothetical protein GCM10022402_12410 [Salinactinospora qingdaonensis]|uniref:Uncharacterized protein n=2 Tax=Salinactinospora qingdaonensis TaxID=702744 RepID=A0ABP7FDL7_9ACTN